MSKDIEICSGSRSVGKSHQADIAKNGIEFRNSFIEKACEWLESYRQDTHDGTGYIAGIVNDKTIEDFKKAMEEWNGILISKNKRKIEWKDNNATLK